MFQNCAKPLDWKREYNVVVWRHKWRICSNNDHHTSVALQNKRKLLWHHTAVRLRSSGPALQSMY